MEKQTKKPKLRFPEFKGEWEVKKIEKYIELISGIALKGDEITEETSGIPILRGINITEGYIRHSKEIDKYYCGDNKHILKYFVKENDLVLGMDGSKVGKNVALITKKDENSILIQRVARIRSTDESDIRYIFQQIFSRKFHDYVDIVNTSSGIPHISSQQIKDFKVGFPSLSEQTKIASFLTTVDDKLQALKKKKTLLAQYKKGVMQKIFSQELRFKNDNGNDYPDWEETKVKDIFVVTRGNVLSMTLVTNEQDENNLFPVYSSQTKNNGLSGYYDKFLFEDCITWTTDGAGAGDVNFRKGKFYCTNVYMFSEITKI